MCVRLQVVGCLWKIGLTFSQYPLYPCCLLFVVVVLVRVKAYCLLRSEIYIRQTTAKIHFSGGDLRHPAIVEARGSG